MIDAGVVARAAVVACIGALTSWAVTPIAITALRRRGLVRPDVHKPGKPLVPTCGGVPLFTALTVASVAAALLFPDLSAKVLVFWLTLLIAFAVGLVDDIYVLKGEVKTLLSLLTIAPIATSAYALGLVVLGRPRVPLLGTLRLTILYWLLLPLAVAGPANVVNMLDIMNGVMPGMSIIALVALAFTSALLKSVEGLVLTAILLGALVGYYPYNKLPARIFSGDSGSLTVGAGLGALAVMTRQELVVMTVLLPHLVNGFLVLASFKGFKEHREVGERPIRVLGDGRLVPNYSLSAPLSLTRLILLVEGGGDEASVVRSYLIIECVAACLAVITALLTVFG